MYGHVSLNGYKERYIDIFVGMFRNVKDITDPLIAEMVVLTLLVSNKEYVFSLRLLQIYHYNVYLILHLKMIKLN